jgi:hypothetical protein
MLFRRAFKHGEPEGHLALFAPVTCYILRQHAEGHLALFSPVTCYILRQNAEKQQLHESSLNQQNAIRNSAICQSKHVTTVCLSINRIRFEQIYLLPSVFRIHKSSFRFLLVTLVGKFDECVLAFSSGTFIVPPKHINTSPSVSIQIKIFLTFFYMDMKRGL